MGQTEEGEIVHHRRFRAFAPAVLAGALAAVVAATATAAPNPRATLTGSAPPWATSSNFKGATSGSDTVGFRVYLGWRGNAAAVAQAVSTPGSASYGKYLTPSQFRQQFSPSQSEVNTVTSWLTKQGFSVDYTPSNNLYVAAEGTVAQAQAAFDASFGEYSVEGLTLRAPTADISVPSSLAGAVEAVVGLDQSSALVHYDHVGADASPSGGFRNARPCSAFWGEKQATDLPAFNGQHLYYAPCGYVSAQLRGAYGLTGAGDGSGQTVAIIDAYASPTILSDANTYFSRHHVQPFKGGQFSQVTAPGTMKSPENPRQDPQGWYGEETLDVEAVHSMAPGANVVYVGAPNNYQDLDAALNHVVDRGLARIVTNSYGWTTELLPSGFVKPYEDILVQAAAEGIGVYFSSGDNGDETQVMGYRTADWPASSPWVTAVGGTSLGVDANNRRVFETYWGTDKYSLKNGKWTSVGWLYGGGGGESVLFGVPSWQTSPYSGGRVVPDVSMVGDPNTGMLVGQTQAFPDGNYYDEYRIGGTSLASPLFAGLMAVADQAAGHPHGFANPALYAAGAGSYNDIATSSSDPLGDVRVDFANGVDAGSGLLYSVRTFGDTLTLHSAPGFDDATGLGTPTSALISALH
jgi:subtilase family serine protease